MVTDGSKRDRGRAAEASRGDTMLVMFAMASAEIMALRAGSGAEWAG